MVSLEHKFRRELDDLINLVREKLRKKRTAAIAHLAPLLDVKPRQIYRWLNLEDLPPDIFVAMDTISYAVDNIDKFLRIDSSKLERNPNMPDIEHNIVPESDIYPLPILGSIPAGNPTDQPEEILGYFSFPKLMLGSNYKKSYVLKVEGQSMAPTVNDGDMVVVVPYREPVSGEFVIARVDGGYTLKKCTGKKDELMPINPEHKKIIANEEIEILGVVKWIVKKP